MSGAAVVAALVLVGSGPWWLAGEAVAARAAALTVRARRGPGARLRDDERGNPSGDGSGAEHARADVPCDPAVVLALLAAASRSGASLARVLGGVGRALGGPEGAALCRAADRLGLGASWPEAWAPEVAAGLPARTTAREASAPTVGRSPAVTVSAALAATVSAALAPTWTHGAAPGPALRAAADQLRRERAERAAQAAGRLGVRLVLPLGLCYLPAFVLVGIVPVLVAYGVGALR